MANLTPASSNDPVFQLETTTLALGGAGQVMNAQAQALLNRLTFETDRAVAAEVLLAPIASPAFTGNPTAVTQAVSNNTTRLATTAFVMAQLANDVTGTYAPIASPTFTGDPKAPTPTFGDNDTSLATTGFVQEAVSRSAIRDVLSTNDTLVLADAGQMVSYGGGSPVAVTVPPNSLVPFPNGTSIDLVQDGTGKVTVVAGVGVSVLSLLGNMSIAGQYSGCTLRQHTTNIWYLLGNLIP